MFGLEKLGSLGSGANDPSATPVIYSKEEIERRRKLAQALMEKGTDTSPVQHWTQGAARVVQALDGAVADYQAQKADRDAQDEGKKISSEITSLMSGSAATPAAAATTSQPTNSLAAPGNIPPVKEGDISKPFLDTLRSGGITNPNALAAIGATGARESGWSGAKAGQTWADPSESGQAGTSGGALSWRADRLRALQNYARANGEQGNGSPETQAKFFMQEDPQLMARLNAAKTPEEAMQHMNNAWRFAGYDRPGGERDARMAEVSKWAGKVASNDPNFMPKTGAPAAPSATPAQDAQAAPAAPVQVAQASQQQSGIPSLARLMALRNNPAFDRAPAGTQAVVNAMIQKAVTQEAKDPLDAEKKRLEIQQLNNSLGNAQLDRESKMLANKKAARELDGKGFRSLTTADEREAAGVPKDYTGAVQIDRDGQLHFPGKAGVEINNNNEKEMDKERGKGLAKRFNDIADEGAKAQEDAIAYQRFGDLLSSVQTGNRTAMLEKVRQLTGVALDPNADNVQALNAAIQHLAPRLRVPGSGAQSDKELGNFLASIPSLIGTPGGNQKILETLQGAVEYKKQRAAIAQAWQLGDITGKEAQKQIDALPSPFAPKKDADGAPWQDVGNGVRIREKGAR